MVLESAVDQNVDLDERQTHVVRVDIEGYAEAVKVGHSNYSLLKCICGAWQTLTGQVVDPETMRPRVHVLRYYRPLHEIDVRIIEAV